jgi:thioredoxin-related protein/YHS domain-containing protein
MRDWATTLLALTLLATSHCTPVHSAPDRRIRWRDDLQLAAVEARNTDKPLLIEFSTSWCGYCKKMRRETFSNAKVITHVESCFVPVTVDGDADQGFTQRMGIRSFPTTLIVSPQMKVVATITGFRTPEQLRDELATVCSHAAPAAQRTRRPAQGVARESVFGGSCPVTLKHEGRIIQGDPRISMVYRGFRVAFQSASHGHAFRQDPRKYWPVADGHCVVSALDEGIAEFGTLEYGVKYRDHVWLFASRAHLERFRQAPETYYRGLVNLLTRTSSPGPTGTNPPRASRVVRAK